MITYFMSRDARRYAESSLRTLINGDWESQKIRTMDLLDSIRMIDDRGKSREVPVHESSPSRRASIEIKDMNIE